MSDRQLSYIADFTGGLNTDKTLRHLGKNELRIANNLDYSERGGVKKRPSFAVHETLTGKDIQYLFEWNTKNGVSELIAVAADGDLIKVSDGQTVGNTSFVASGFDYEVLQGYLYLVDGNNYYRIDDSTYNIEVVQAKDTSYYEYFAEEFTEVTAGTTYNLEYEDLQENSETIQDSVGEEGEYTKGTDYTIDYVDGNFTVLSGGAMVGDNVFVEYNYFVESDVDLTNVKKCKYLTRHMKSNRFFAAGNPDDPGAVYYSELLEPNNFKGYSVVYPTTNDGAVQGLATLNDMLLVFFQNSVWLWRGIDPQQDAVWDKLPIKHGIYNQDGVELTSGTLTFIDLDGIYSLSSMSNAENITDNKISNVIKGINNRTDIVSKFVSKENKYFLAYSDNTTSNNKLLMGDWNLGAYSIWDNITAADIEYTLDGEFYYCSGDTIYKLTDTYTENITMKLQTKEYVLGNPYGDKLIKRLHLSLNKVTGSSIIRVITDDNTQVFDVTSKTQRFDIEERAITVQIEFEDTSTDNLIVYDIGIEYKPISTYRSDKL